MVKAWVVAGLTLLLWSERAQAKGWDAPTFVLEAHGSSTSNLFPGSALSTPDRGVAGAVSAKFARRVSSTSKMGIDVDLSGEAWSNFGEASFAEFAAGSWWRRGGTTLRIDGALTPSRLKFPATLDGGRFSRIEGRAGIRQALGPKLRLRVEGRAQRDDFVTTYDSRDGDTGEGYVQLALRASDAVTLRVDALAGRTTTTSVKYAHADRTVGGAVAVARGVWTAELAVTSGLSRYDRATISDSNYQRRDQSIETRAQLGRALGRSLTVMLAGSFYDQTSSRPDRTYDLHRMQLGLEWHPVAP